MTTRPRKPKHAPRVPFALLVAGLVVGGLVLLLALNTASAANELRRHDLANRDAVIAAQVQELRNEVAASAAPANLAAAAVQLGMVPAGSPAFLVIGANGVIKVMGSPAAATDPPVALPPVPKTTAAKPTTTATKTTSATKSATSTAHASTSSSKSRSPKSSAKRTPTSTPTPTVTLPGGTR
ncbi:MAG: hypothetical protein QOF92_4815 [Pseudonocardiales bacterium]|jgi:hypothetical protein|nr:hypothetical protein [Pseudonocardiales bacterium]